MNAVFFYTILAICGPVILRELYAGLLNLRFLFASVWLICAATVYSELTILYAMTFQGVALITTSIISFLIGSYVVEPISIQYARRRRAAEMPSYKLKTIIMLACISAIFAIYVIISAGGVANLNRDAILEQAEAYANQGGGLSIGPALGTELGRLTIVLIVIGMPQGVKKNKTWLVLVATKLILAAAVIVPSFLWSIAQVAKSPLITATVSFAVLFFAMAHARALASSATNPYPFLRRNVLTGIIKLGAVSVVIVAASWSIYGLTQDKERIYRVSQYTIVENSSFYVGGGAISLGVMLESNLSDEIAQNSRDYPFGNTFSLFYRMLDKMGLVEDYKTNIYKIYIKIPRSSNAYTWVLEPYIDGGYPFVIIVSFFLGVVSTLIYWMFVYRPTILMGYILSYAGIFITMGFFAFWHPTISQITIMVLTYFGSKKEKA
jgi:oligosaccharide repeat unit polymerase